MKEDDASFRAMRGTVSARAIREAQGWPQSRRFLPGDVFLKRCT